MPPDSILIAYENLLHDIKTPMALLFTSLQMAEKSTDISCATMEHIQDAEKNWFMVMKLLNDTSDHAKINSGTLVPRFKNYDITCIIKDMVEGTRTLADRKNIRISFESDIPGKTMAADKAMIERIILNLLSNAIKFTGNGGMIRVQLREEDSQIVLNVQDNGPGISDEIMSRITERYNCDKSEFNKHGSGIGLNIIKELTGLLGGVMNLESTNTGTAVTVRLPVFTAEQDYEEMLIDDFYGDKIMQIELSEHYVH